MKKDIIEQEIDLLREEPVKIKLEFLKDESGKILDWTFFINDSEEMSMSISKQYENAYIDLLKSVYVTLSKNIGDLSWLTIGGADYQLVKLQHFGLNVLVDPLAGHLNNLLVNVESGVFFAPFVREVPMLFSEFLNSDYNYSEFDIVTVDVSDPIPEKEKDTALEIYNSSFLENVLPFISRNGFLIMYEGVDFSLGEKDGSKKVILVPESLRLIKKVECGYSKMSLWRKTC
jgi:hypothetical protein